MHKPKHIEVIARDSDGFDLINHDYFCTIKEAKEYAKRLRGEDSLVQCGGVQILLNVDGVCQQDWRFDTSGRYAKWV